MNEYNISKKEARIFLLLKHGLLGEYQYKTEDDIMRFVEMVGCIQYDPIDVCGKNSELVLQSRFKSFRKKMLYNQLYQKRNLIDYFDKNMAIFPTSEWPYFERIRDQHKNNMRHKEEVEKVFEKIEEQLKSKEYISSKDLDNSIKVDWFWSKTSLSRAALETMYFNGDLVIHHKDGTRRFFSLTINTIDKDILRKGDPYPNDLDHKAWRVLRRIKGVGMLWNKPSDAYLYIQNLKSSDRNLVFNMLIKEQKIIKVNVEGLKKPLYIDSRDEHLLKEVIGGIKLKDRCEFIAPLDNLLWDRNLIKDLFDFDYKWEIYTPLDKRKFGYYTLPVLYGTSFIGRIEAIADRKYNVLIIKNLWLEPNVIITDKEIEIIQNTVERFKMFNEVEEVKYNLNYLHKS